MRIPVRRLTLGWCAVMVTALLSACVALPPAQKANASLLASVVIMGDEAMQLQPVAIILDLDDMSAGTTRQFVFEANSLIPGHRAEFPVRMDVPAGQHRLSRISAVAPDGTAIAALDLGVEIDIEASAGSTDYLGHLEMSRSTDPDLAADAARLVLVDAYEDDLPDFVHAWPELRRRKIGRCAPESAMTVSLTQPSLQEIHHHARAEPLDATAASHLPRRSQLAFEAFLKNKYPRAFAIGQSGATGVAAGGANVIERALRDCRRAAGKRRQTCRLFALDDTLIQTLDGSSGAIGTSAGK